MSHKSHDEQGKLPVFDDPEQEAIFARQGCLTDVYPPRGQGKQAQLNRASGKPSDPRSKPKPKPKTSKRQRRRT